MKLVLVCLSVLAIAPSVLAESPVPRETLVELTQEGGFFPPPPPGGEQYCNYKEVTITNYGDVTITKCGKNPVEAAKLSSTELSALTDTVESLPQEISNLEPEQPQDSANPPPPSCGHNPQTMFFAYKYGVKRKVAAHWCDLYVAVNARAQGKAIAELLMKIYGAN